MDQTKKQLKDAFDKLPEKLRQYVVVSDWENKLRDILVTQNLTEEQKVEINNEALLALLGVTDPDDLALALRTTAKLSDGQSEQLAQEIGEKIFSPAEDELLELDPINIEDYAAYQALPVGTKEALQKLPDDLRKIILSTETADKIQAIGQKYNLHIDQMGALDEEVHNVLFGVSSPSKLTEQIKNRLGIEQSAADKITYDLNEQIFLKIRESLQALHETNEATEANEAIGGVEPIPASPAPPETLPTDLPNRDEIMDGIEHPKDTPAIKEDSVFEQKMGKLFRIPREEVDLDPYLEKPK